MTEIRRAIRFLFFALIFSIATLLLLIGVFVGAQAHDYYTVTLEDVSKTSCDELPTLAYIDQIFAKNAESFSHLLDELSSCQNNIQVCNRSGKCKEIEYKKRTLKSGNTVFTWLPVSECRHQQKAALLISHTSACEIQKIHHYFRSHPKFDELPIQSINY